MFQLWPLVSGKSTEEETSTKLFLMLLLLLLFGVDFGVFYDTFYTQNEVFLVPIVLCINSYKSTVHSAQV